MTSGSNTSETNPAWASIAQHGVVPNELDLRHLDEADFEDAIYRLLEKRFYACIVPFVGGSHESAKRSARRAAIWSWGPERKENRTLVGIVEGLEDQIEDQFRLLECAARCLTQFEAVMKANGFLTSGQGDEAVRQRWQR